MCADSPEMWEFNPVTKEWAWISGQDSANVPPVYGTQGVASDTSNPSGREMAAAWTDAEGNLWLFSGYAFDGQSSNAPDDLWMYNTTNNQWTWVGGNSSASQPSVYGALGVPAAANWPDSRGVEGASATWVDAQGNFWLFGGDSGNNSNGGYLQNDLWVYHASPAATPTFNVSGGTYTAAQTVTISDTTPGATIYYTTDGSTPTAKSTTYSQPVTVSATATINAIAIATGYPTSAVATAAYTISIPANPVPVISGLSPALATAGSTAFTLTVNGSEFTSQSTVYWGTTALATTFVSAAKLTAPVTASEIASAGITAITVQTPTPGGGTSNSFQFEVDSATGTSTPPTFTVSAATVTAGSPASYPVTLPSTVESATVSCLNLPTGAVCGYSSTNNALTITTSSTTPKGTYQVTVIFTETVTGAATSWILLPFLLLPLAFLRRQMAARGYWVTACLALILLTAAACTSGCGGGAASTTTTSPQTHQVTSSGAVSLTVQ